MKRIPHFYQLHSRLGLKNTPIGSSTPNIGVEDGPNAVLSQTFLEQFPESNIDSFFFSKPESLTQTNYYPTLAQESAQACELLKQTVKEDEIQVVIGGDHSVAFVSVASILQRFEKESIGLILFDSHGDLHLHQTSITKNFHGMWLRSVLDRFDVPELEAVLPNKIQPQNVLFIGNLLLEAEEQNFIHQHRISVFPEQDLPNATQKISDFIQKFDHIHISFDIDVFSQSLVNATGTPNPNGCSIENIFPIMTHIADTVSQFSLDLVEVNPQKNGANETIELAQAVLATFLQ